MTAGPETRRRRRMDAVGVALLAFGALNILTGLAMLFAPGAFFESVGPYGTRNDHYIGDLSTWSLALGAALVVAARRKSWRVPVLAVAVLQGGLHALNHLVDVGEARPFWLGPFNLVALTVVAALLGLLLVVSVRRLRGTGRR